MGWERHMSVVQEPRCQEVVRSSDVEAIESSLHH